MKIDLCMVTKTILPNLSQNDTNYCGENEFRVHLEANPAHWQLRIELLWYLLAIYFWL